MAVGTQDCIKAADIARLQQKAEDFMGWQSRQNGSLQAMEDSIRLIAASADNRLSDLDKRFNKIQWFLLGIESSIIVGLIIQWVVKGTI